MPVIEVDYEFGDTFKEALNDRQMVNKLKVKINESKSDEFKVVPSLMYANNELVKRLMMASDNQHKQQLIDGNSDLIANLYEGGFKLWEGLNDLVEYLGQSKELDYLTNSNNVNILELGCGSGLVSIYLSSILPSSTLYLQDFNEDVIRYFTAVNVKLNNQISISELNSRFKYLSGDWSDVNQDIDALNLKFDLIISSETLYNVDNYPKIVKLIESSLSVNGYAYIASKSHYFGVGGGSYSFIEFIEKHSQLECDISHEIDAPLIRHILKLKLKN